MPRYAILGVEGPHDQAFITKLLRGLGFENYDGTVTGLDPFWNPFVPKYPRGGRLYVRLDMPAIVFNTDISVAIFAGEGTNLTMKFPATFVNHPVFKTEIAAFGIIADSDKSPCARVAAEYAAVYREHFPQFPSTPGIIDTSSIRTGIFVLPDNANQGTLDNIILECANAIYPSLRADALRYLNGINREALEAEDLREINRPFGENKAWASCISSVLKPGKTIQVSIQDNRWLEGTSLMLPRIMAVSAFLRELLALPES
jgi:hypothetical protein